MVHRMLTLKHEINVSPEGYRSRFENSILRKLSVRSEINSSASVKRQKS
jgi:hypothetical protein